MPPVLAVTARVMMDGRLRPEKMLPKFLVIGSGLWHSVHASSVAEAGVANRRGRRSGAAGGPGARVGTFPTGGVSTQGTVTTGPGSNGSEPPPPMRAAGTSMQSRRLIARLLAGAAVHE